MSNAETRGADAPRNPALRDGVAPRLVFWTDGEHFFSARSNVPRELVAELYKVNANRLRLA